MAGARLRIGFASPVSLHLLRHLVRNGEQLPAGYLFAPSADWVQELIRRGHHVTLYTTAREIAEPATFVGDHLTIRIASARSKGAGRDLFAQERKQLKRMMLEDRCDVIHAHWTYEFALAALATKIPTLVTIHDLPWKVLYHFKDMYRAARLLMAYQVAFRGKHFTAVSEDAAAHFRKGLRPGLEITVVPNGLPAKVFELGAKSYTAPEDNTTFATVLQGWSRQKNPETVLRAFQIARRELPSLRLLMFGRDFESCGPAHRWAVKRHLDANVTFVGIQSYEDLLRRIQQEVDILVHPSLDESFSMAALEAMALRKPVVAGVSTTGVREVLGFGAAGVLVDITKPKDVARAMAALALDHKQRALIAEKGFIRASSLYRLDTVIAQYENLYLSLRTPPATARNLSGRKISAQLLQYFRGLNDRPH